MRYADTQWEAPVDATPEQKAYADKGYSWQTRIWIDDMFMITTIQSQAIVPQVTGSILTVLPVRWRCTSKRFSVPTDCFYHSPEAPLFSGHVGNGWMAAGMAQLLSILPKDNSDRTTIMEAYKKMMNTLKQNQDPDGMWHQLIDEPASYKETSGTAMFTYAMIVGVKHGWLDKKEYGTAARKGWLALVTYINENDEITNVCEGTNIKNDRNHYMNRKQITGDLHAHAPLLWCAVALLGK